MCCSTGHFSSQYSVCDQVPVTILVANVWRQFASPMLEIRVPGKRGVTVVKM